MENQSQSESCKFATRDHKVCIPVGQPCRHQEKQSGCVFYQELETPVRGSSIVFEQEGQFWRGRSGSWYLDTPARIIELDELFEAFGDEHVKLRIERVR